MGEKTATYEGYSALVAHETVTVPVSSLKRYKLGSAQTLAQQEKTIFFIYLLSDYFITFLFLFFLIIANSFGLFVVKTSCQLWYVTRVLCRYFKH